MTAVPTTGECFARLIENLRKAQEEAATLAHLERANDQRTRALGWLTVSEGLKLMQRNVTDLATKRLN